MNKFGHQCHKHTISYDDYFNVGEHVLMHHPHIECAPCKPMHECIHPVHHIHCGDPWTEPIYIPVVHDHCHCIPMPCHKQHEIPEFMKPHHHPHCHEHYHDHCCEPHHHSHCHPCPHPEHHVLFDADHDGFIEGGMVIKPII